MLAAVSWPIWERIQIVGDFAISPHGITVALGFLAGAQLMLRRAEARGVARRHVPNIGEEISAIVTRAAIGGILGARIFYVATRPDQFDSLLEVLEIWAGGLSLLGGIAGAFILALPHIWRRRLSLPLLLDSLGPGLALGIFIGRIGDLVIGEHLGGRTDFVLGWRCSGQFVQGEGMLPPEAFTGPQVQGCFNAAVHQTALYDFLAGGVVFALILWLERRSRFDGFFGLTFGIGYATLRFLSDFARDADKDLLGPLTGTQLTTLAIIATGLVWLAATRPWTTTPYAWTPGQRAPWVDPPEPEDEPADEELDAPGSGTR